MKRMIVLLAAMAASCAALGAEEEDSSFTEEKLSVYGYAVDFAGFEFEDADASGTALGNILYLRLKADFRPQDALLFHVEGSYDARTGNQNALVLAQGYGIAPPVPAAYAPVPRIEHAWGSATFGSFSMRFGKLPIGWGSAYVLNPTQRTARLSFLDPVTEEAPGILALAPAWSPLDALRLSGYVAFQDKSLREAVVLMDGAWENLPFGFNVMTTLGKFDISASIMKEIEYIDDPAMVDPYLRSWFAGLDCAGAVWDFGVYAEAALRLPVAYDGETRETDGYDFEESLELSAGFEYLVPGIEVQARAEYCHIGSGESDSAAYDVLSVLGGRKFLQAEDYVYAAFERTFADYFTANIGGIINLNDASLVGRAEISYAAKDNLTLKLGASLPWGGEGSEFDGRYDLTGLGLGAFDLMKPSIYASCKLSF